MRHRTARACFVDRWSRHRFERIGTLFAVPPAVIFHAKSDELSSLTSLMCELALKPVLELFDQRLNAGDLTEERLMACLDIRHMKVHGLMWRLAEEARHPGFASEMLVESIAAQLAVELFRHETAMRERVVHGGLAPWQLRVIDERLREVGPAPTLTNLAALCHLSIRQLSRGFRATRGVSIGAYVANSQMQHAAVLLTTEGSVSSIAITLGFASTSNFCAAFQRATGVTPGQFRKTMVRC
jgi:AraC family transcriptional regulator